MTPPPELIRNVDDIRRFLAQSAWLVRAVAPSPAYIGKALHWAYEMAAAGDPILPLGWIADVGHAALGIEHAPGAKSHVHVPNVESHLLRRYEDDVLGKLLVDALFDRGGAALVRFAEHDRPKALAFLLEQVRRRAEIPGVAVNPAVLKTLAEQPVEALLGEGWTSLSTTGLDPRVLRAYESLISQFRIAGDLLGAEDVFELERGTALLPFAQRLALRQVLATAAEFMRQLPQHRLAPPPKRHEVPTHIVDEDAYPIGGYSSLSNRGSIESLLHSQLAYMERDERPDLFDIKFLRDELLYFSRDENQFLRRRHTVVIAFDPSLERARYKDVELPRQRIVLLTAVITALVQKLIEWLSHDALVFEFVWIEDPERPPLDEERKVLELIFAEEMVHGTVRHRGLSAAALTSHCEAQATRSLARALILSTYDLELEPAGVAIARIVVNQARPQLGWNTEPLALAEGETALDGWRTLLLDLLREWS